MQSFENARKGYKTMQKEVGFDAELELKIFTDITGRLSRFDPTRASQTGEFYQAVYDNAQLWNILYIDLMQAENQLDDSLKANLLSLAIFIATYTPKVLSGEAGSQVLIEINRNIIDGNRAFLVRDAEIEAA